MIDLSNQIDFPAFFSLRKMTYRISSIPEYDSLLQSLPVRWPYAVMFSKLTFWNYQSAESQFKFHREYSGKQRRIITFTRQKVN
jgi:hypothetical protein